MAVSCYDTIIGISRQRCDCYSDMPEGYDTSDSGLYIEDLEALDMLSGLASDCKGDLWDLAFDGRKHGILQFIADSNAMLTQRFRHRREPFKGTIGSATGRNTLSTSRTYVGIQLACNPIRSGTLKVTKVGGIFAASGTVTYKVYNNLNALLYTQAVSVVANQHTTRTVNWSLPLHINYTDVTQYFIVYEHSALNPAKLNNFDCGCGGFKPYFNLNKPHWSQQHNGTKGWLNWVMINGWTGDNLTDFDNTSTAQGASLDMNGITLECDFRCDITDFICPPDGLDFDSSELARTVALCVYWQTGVTIANRVLSSSDVSRLVQANREEITKQRDTWTSKYQEALRYVIAQLDEHGSDCLTCRPKFEMKTGLIQ